MNLGEVSIQKDYNTDSYEVMVQTGFRGEPRRVCLCHKESDAEYIGQALLEKFAKDE